MIMDHQQSFVIIGAGNVAFHLSGALMSAGFTPRQVISKSLTHAHELAVRLGCDYTTDIEQMKQ